MRYDVAIAGGGPAGLACAIESARRGLSTVVLERRTLPCDKACGEGILPSGVAALASMGVLPLLTPADASRLIGVRYHQEDGTIAEARLPRGGGLGVRRTALSVALTRRARDAGAVVRDQVEVKSHLRTARSVVLHTTAGAVEASLLVAADGLRSPSRRAERIEVAAQGPRRFGMRRHYGLAPTSAFVEVWFAQDAEAYVTPAGERRTGVALLWDADQLPGPVSFDALLGRFPDLARRLQGAPFDSTVRGAGPFACRALRTTLDRFVLLGDAAGYVDAITGEGLSLAFGSAIALARILPQALAADATAMSLAAFERAHLHEFRRYAFWARTVLHVAAHPHLRRRILRALERHPLWFDLLLCAAVA